MVICLQRCADLHMVQLMPLPLTVSCFSKIQIGFTFLVLAHLGSSRQRAVKRVCVCVNDHNPSGYGQPGPHIIKAVRADVQKSCKVSQISISYQIFCWMTESSHSQPLDHIPRPSEICSHCLCYEHLSPTITQQYSHYK